MFKFQIIFSLIVISFAIQSFANGSLRTSPNVEAALSSGGDRKIASESHDKKTDSKSLKPATKAKKINSDK